jgi:hypothetical protein
VVFSQKGLYPHFPGETIKAISLCCQGFGVILMGRKQLFNVKQGETDTGEYLIPSLNINKEKIIKTLPPWLYIEYSLKMVVEIFQKTLLQV